MTEKAIAAELAEFVSDTRFEDIPTDVIEKLRVHFLDLVGAQVVGSKQRWNVLLREYAVAESPAGSCSFVGGGSKGRPEWAALANAASAQGFEADDYHSSAMLHPAAVTFPTAAAICEEIGATDEAFLCASAVAFETSIRIGMAAEGGLVAGRGFHSPTSVGPFAAATAAGKLRQLDVPALVNAFGIAGSHSGGTMEYTQSGGEVKRLHAGLGCMSGIRAVELASRRLTGPPTIFEGKRGFYQALSNNVNLDKITHGLGERWLTLDTALKRYCTYAGIQAPLAAIHQMIEQDGLLADDVDEIIVGLDANGMRSAGSIGPHPKEMIAAQFSVHFSIGLAFTAGGNDFSHYLDAQKSDFSDPSTLSIAEKVRLELDDIAEATFLDNRSCRVVVTRKSGPPLERRVNAPGSAASPLPSGEVIEKFHSMARLGLSEGALIEVEKSVLGMPNGNSLASLLDILRNIDSRAE